MPRRTDLPPTATPRRGTSGATGTRKSKGKSKGPGHDAATARATFDPAWEAELARHNASETAAPRAMDHAAPAITKNAAIKQAPTSPSEKAARAAHHLRIATALACAAGGLAAAAGLHFQGWPHHGSVWSWAALAAGALGAGLAYRFLPRQGPWPARALGAALLLAAPALLWGGARLSDTVDRSGFAQGIETRIAAGVADLDLRPPAGAVDHVADSLLIPVDEGGAGIACLRDGDAVKAVAVRPGTVPGSSLSQPWAIRDRAGARALCARAFAKADAYGWMEQASDTP